MPLPRLSGRRLASRITASATAGTLLAGLPATGDYLVRPGDTLSEIAERHRTTVGRLVQRNDLPASGDVLVAGRTLRVPDARSARSRRPASRPEEQRPGDRRRIVRYTVRPGDTPSGLAVRFHAWTAEVIALNGPVLRVGEQVRIPVVPAAARPGRPAGPSLGQGRPAGQSLAPDREAVRRTIVRVARRHGVDPHLALAVSWQESGWQMHPVSSAGAVGAMQVLPATGDWMSDVVGRPLDLHRLRDNVTAGVALLDLLLGSVPRATAVAGYYQGLAGVRADGMYPDTRRYVANVLALERRIAQGTGPR